MAMTHTQRILAAARGEMVDKLPFGARIDTWYNYHSAHGTLPEKYQGWSETDIIADQGAGAQKRFFSVCKESFRDMEVITNWEGNWETREYITPIGTCSIKLLWSTNEGPWLAYEHEKLFKTAKDYTVIKYILEHTEPYYNTDYDKEREAMGERGIVMTGTGLWSPAQRIMREIMGYEQFFEEMMDNPEEVAELIEVMSELELKKLKIAADSKLELINLCANWSDDIHTPVFRQFFTPYFKQANEIIHAAGKLSMAHADGEMRRLLPLFGETEIDVAEAVTPAPQSSMTMSEFKQGYGDKVTLWGGISSVMFEPAYSDQEFDDFVIRLIKEMAPGQRFILGMADNLPFDGDINRIGRVVDLIEKYGKLPIWI